MKAPFIAVLAGLLMTSGSALARDDWNYGSRHDNRNDWQRHDHRHYDKHGRDRDCDHDRRYGRVTYSAPVVVYQTQPRVVYRERVIYRESPQVYQRGYDNYPRTSHGGNNAMMGQAVGAIAGGVLGNQIGGGNGRIVATAVGAVIGSAIGGEIASR